MTKRQHPRPRGATKERSLRGETYIHNTSREIAYNGVYEDQNNSPLDQCGIKHSYKIKHVEIVSIGVK